MNWDILGHEWAVSLLQRHITGDTLRQAYLFTGPRGVGRRTLALKLAQAVNCLQPPAPGEFCSACRACKQIALMQHPDLSVTQAESEGGTLKVDQVRELQRSLSLAPYEARSRVALILRFEEAHPSAANALLKTLEEPPPKVILLLTAQNAESLLPTIVSRCEVIRLRPLPLDVAAEGLQTRWNASPEEARLLAHLSGGRPGFAVHLLQSPDQMERRKAGLDDLLRLLRASRVERFAYADPASKDKDSLRSTLLHWLSFWRDALLQTSGAASPLANLDYAQPIAELASRSTLPAARRAVAALERTLDLLDKNVNTRLALEVLLLNLPRF